MTTELYPTRVRQQAVAIADASLPTLAAALRQEITMIERLAKKLSGLAIKFAESPEELNNAIAQVQGIVDQLSFSNAQRKRSIAAVAASRGVAPASFAGIIATIAPEQSQEFLQLQQQFVRHKQQLAKAHHRCQAIAIYHLRLQNNLVASLLPTSTYNAQGRLQKRTQGRAISRQS